MAIVQTNLVVFNGTDGATPRGSLIADANGDLFGTTQFGGTNNEGTVFELAKNGASYTPSTLVSFTGGSGGFQPWGSLIADAHGDLFGTTSGGGPNGFGTVFEIVKGRPIGGPTRGESPSRARYGVPRSRQVAYR
jgi:uncharacterized repeat protein (TIGR03803 family)